MLRSKRKSNSVYATAHVRGKKSARRDVITAPVTVTDNRIPVTVHQLVSCGVSSSTPIQSASNALPILVPSLMPSVRAPLVSSGYDNHISYVTSQTQPIPVLSAGGSPTRVAPVSLCSSSVNEGTVNSMSNSNISFTPILSIRSQISSHVSVANINKITNGEYVELGQLLQNPNTEKQEKQLILIDGMLQTKERAKQSITSIEKWTDAFLIFSSIYLGVHSEKYQDILKYMHVVRLCASRVQGMGWKSYDEQFRYRMSLDPTNSWENIDNQLWLLYMSDYQAVQQGKGFTPQFRQFKVAGSHQAFNICYAFNYKGHCDRMQCYYEHVCTQCSAAHPVISCRFNHEWNHSFRSGHPNSSQFFPVFRAQTPFRARFPSRAQTRTQTSVMSRYLGPRQISNKH